MSQRNAHTGQARRRSTLRKLLALVVVAAAMALTLGVGQARTADRTDVLAPPDLFVTSATPLAVTVTNAYALYGQTPLYRPTATAGAFRVSVAIFRRCAPPCIYVLAGSKTFSISALAPGASVGLPIWDLPQGSLAMVHVDYLAQVYERDETNNNPSFGLW